MPKPPKEDYDAWQAWVERTVLPMYSRCAAKVDQLINAFESKDDGKKR